MSKVRHSAGNVEFISDGLDAFTTGHYHDINGGIYYMYDDIE